MSKDRLMILVTALASIATLASCSSGGGDSFGGGTENTPPTQSFDIQAADVTSDGCLQLPALYEKLKALPSEARLRRYTPDFNIQPADSGSNELRRNFVAIVSFSNFLYEEKSAPLFIPDYPAVTQTACESAQFSSPLEGTQILQIVPTENANILKMVRDDGAEITYELKGPRELEIRFSGDVIDPCPNYNRAKATNIQKLTWGTDSEMEQAPLLVSKSFLNQISVGVQDMPTELASLAVTSDSDFVTASALDLRSLTASSLDPRIQNCPYKASPPDGEEPPPPSPAPPPSPTPVETTPTPTPTPTPAPDSSPAPAPTPDQPPVILPGF